MGSQACLLAGSLGGEERRGETPPRRRSISSGAGAGVGGCFFQLLGCLQHSLTSEQRSGLLNLARFLFILHTSCLFPSNQHLFPNPKERCLLQKACYIDSTCEVVSVEEWEENALSSNSMVPVQDSAPLTLPCLIPRNHHRNTTALFWLPGKGPLYPARMNPVVAVPSPLATFLFGDALGVIGRSYVLSSRIMAEPPAALPSPM